MSPIATRIALAAALGALALLAEPAAQVRTPGAAAARTGTASLGGRALSDGKPVARAHVAITPSDDATEFQTVTDQDGRFLFSRLPGGRYLVVASKMGWVTTHYGSPRHGYPPGVRVAVEDGGRATIEIPMIRASAIAGRIVHEDGRVMPRQFPWLLEQRMVGDRRMLARARMPYDIGNFERSTDDRGEFRLFGLPPGTYYLLVRPTIASGARLTTTDEVRWAMQPPTAAAGPPPSAPVAGYATHFFPGTTDPAQAQPIVVGPGDVREALTFRVGFVDVSRVDGTAQRPDGSPAASANVTMRQREMNASLEGSDRIARTDASGRFTFQNVPPGEYRISMRASSTSSPSELDLWAQTDVRVSGGDVDGVGLALAPASTISGRVSFDGASPPPADLSVVRLHFSAVDAIARAMSAGGSGGQQPPIASVQADGTFRVSGLPPDRYLVGASWPGMRSGDGTTGWWITSIRVGDRELGDAPIGVDPNTNVGDVLIAFSDRIGAIEGRLIDAAGRPAPEYFVLAFPVERSSWTTVSRRIVPPARPGTDGRYRLTGFLEGDYYLAVVTTMDSDDGSDPAFLEAIVPGAIRVTIGRGQTIRQDLQVGR
jgi:hypothetical protein